MTSLLRLSATCAAGIGFAALTSAHDVITTPITFSREISRLVYARCGSCHRPGGRAFSLLSYAEARPWATAIKEEILERRMPPWSAVKGFGDFQDDQGLTQEQIDLIANWVEGGAPEGDPKLLPPLPKFTSDRPRFPQGIPVEDVLTVKTAITLAGIRPERVTDTSAAVVTATRPDGSIEPLLWLYNYQPRFPQMFWYRTPIRLEAGTRIQITPPGAATFALIAQAPRAGRR